MDTKQTEVTTMQIINANAAIGQLGQDKLPISVSFKLGLLNKSLLPVVEEFNKARDAAIKEFSEVVDEVKGEYKLVKVEEFNKVMNELAATKHTLAHPVLKLKDFGDHVAHSGSIQSLVHFFEE